MSIKLTSAVWESGAYSGTTLIILLALADHGQDDGTCIWPSVARLAAKARVDRRTVQRTIRLFEEDGVLVCVGGAKGGRSQPREYCLDVTKLPTPPDPEKGDTGAALSENETGQKGDMGAALSDIKGDTGAALSDAERAASHPERAAQLCRPNLSEPSNNPPIVPPNARHEAREPDPAIGGGVSDRDAEAWDRCRQMLAKRKGAAWCGAWLDKVTLWQAEPERIVILGGSQLYVDRVFTEAGRDIATCWRRDVEFHIGPPGAARRVWVSHWRDAA